MRITILVAILIMAGCTDKDDSDPAEGRSGMIVYTDALTLCQYLYRGNLTPRMNADGTQVCEVRK